VLSLPSLIVKRGSLDGTAQNCHNVVLGGSWRSEAVQDVWRCLALLVDSRFGFM
jgi:hypothetical protein